MLNLDGEVEVHVPHRVDVVSDGRGPWSCGSSHRENGVRVAYSRAQTILVCQVLRPDSLVLTSVKQSQILPDQLNSKNTSTVWALEGLMVETRLR